VLGDLDEAARYEATRRHARRLHQRLPFFAADASRGFRRADRCIARAFDQQIENRLLERCVVGVAARTAASVGAVLDGVPVARPLRAPFHGASATRARF